MAITMTTTTITQTSKFIKSESTSSLSLLPEMTALCSPNVFQTVMPTSTPGSILWSISAYIWIFVAIVIMVMFFAIMEDISKSQFKKMMEKREEKDEMCRKDIREMKEEMKAMDLKLAQVFAEHKERGECQDGVMHKSQLEEMMS